LRTLVIGVSMLAVAFGLLVSGRRWADERRAFLSGVSRLGESRPCLYELLRGPVAIRNRLPVAVQAYSWIAPDHRGTWAVRQIDVSYDDNASYVTAIRELFPEADVRDPIERLPLEDQKAIRSFLDAVRSQSTNEVESNPFNLLPW
jgi:hypothetical protein